MERFAGRSGTPAPRWMRCRDHVRRGSQLFTAAGLPSGWSLWPLVYLAHRISRPSKLRGLGKLSAGTDRARRGAARRRKIGRAIQAFNDMAAGSRKHRAVVYLAAPSWQTLARKMAHEVKNRDAHTADREEMLRVRRSDRSLHGAGPPDRGGEIETLERRVRAFSQFCHRAARAVDEVSQCALQGASRF